MTFMIAKIIDQERQHVTLFSDTRITHRFDADVSRHSLRNPGQKVVIINDNIVIGFSGDDPSPSVNFLAELRGQKIDTIKTELLRYSRNPRQSKNFLLISKNPRPKIIVISNGSLEDRTSIGTGWIGDYRAFRHFNATFNDRAAPPDLPLEQRFFIAMTNLVVWEDLDTVGGYLVRVTGTCDDPFRFRPDQLRMMPDSVVGSIRTLPGNRTEFQFSLEKGADSTRHNRIPVPGKGRTYGALALYIPEAGTAWLQTHERPGDEPKRLTVTSLEELVATSKTKYGQLLNYALTRSALESNAKPTLLFTRPYPTQSRGPRRR